MHFSAIVFRKKVGQEGQQGPCKSLILPVSQDFASAANAMATYKVTQSYGPSIYYVSNFRVEGFLLRISIY